MSNNLPFCFILRHCNVAKTAMSLQRRLQKNIHCDHFHTIFSSLSLSQTIAANLLGLKYQTNLLRLTYRLHLSKTKDIVSYNNSFYVTVLSLTAINNASMATGIFLFLGPTTEKVFLFHFFYFFYDFET